jgi:DnaK suppressor protein
MPWEGFMNGAELQTIRQHLLNERTEILNKSFDFKVEQRNSLITSRADESEATTSDILNSMSYHLHERDRGLLQRIDKALGKMANNSYGLCEGCSGEISWKRLAARPFAEYCIDCQEEQESHHN